MQEAQLLSAAVDPKDQFRCHWKWDCKEPPASAYRWEDERDIYYLCTNHSVVANRLGYWRLVGHLGVPPTPPAPEKPEIDLKNLPIGTKVKCWSIPGVFNKNPDPDYQDVWAYGYIWKTHEGTAYDDDETKYRMYTYMDIGSTSFGPEGTDWHFGVKDIAEVIELGNGVYPP